MKYLVATHGTFSKGIIDSLKLIVKISRSIVFQ